MEAERLAYFKSRLLTLKQHLLQEIANLQEATQALSQDTDYGVSNHMADEATDIYEREKNQALIEDRRQVLDKVEAALDRVEDGSYGICLRTGQPIAEERLEAIPYAEYSIAAQQNS